MKKFFKDISFSFLGCVLAAFGTACFLIPNKLSTGGFSGIATILYYAFGLKVGTTIILLNIPSFLWAYVKLGKRFLGKTIIATVLFSKLIDVFEFVDMGINDRFLASIYGGILVGAGLGLIFRQGASTGGTDLIAAIVQKYNSHIKVSQVIGGLDFIIVFASLLTFKSVEIGLYSFIAIVIASKVIDLIFEGTNFSKMIYIISDDYEKIAKAINEDLEKGATLIYGRGSFSGKQKMIIMCAVKRNNILKLKQIVKNIDKNAFIIITNVVEVFGLGFKNGCKLT